MVIDGYDNAQMYGVQVSFFLLRVYVVVSTGLSQ